MPTTKPKQPERGRQGQQEFSHPEEFPVPPDFPRIFFSRYIQPVMPSNNAVLPTDRKANQVKIFMRNSVTDLSNHADE